MLKVGLSGFERSGAPGLRKIWSGGAIFHEFGQVGEIRRLGSTRFWRVWQLGCDFSSVWASRGDSQVRRHAVLEGLAAGVRAASASRARAARSEPPPPTQKSESRPRRPFVECLGVGGVPHQLDGGGRVRVPDLCQRESTSSRHIRTALLDDFCVRK